MADVVYLHGFASGPGSRKAQVIRRSLEAAGFEVAVPDLADGNFEALTITGQLSVLERIAGGKPVRLVGSSMGGYLAALYAAAHPEVTQLALMAPAFDFPRAWAAGYDAETLAEWRRTGKMSVFHYAEGGSRDLGYQIVEDAAKYDAFPGFTQPALIFHGVHDSVAPVERSKGFAAGHPNVRLEILDAGHDLLNVLDYMTAAIVSFFRTGGL
jgi:pimeloyl-ACP methyl ester carboxylesterase